MKKNILMLAIAVVLISGFTACSHSTEKTGTEQSTMAEAYQCPMKCEGEKTYEKAGSCPVCKMDLEKTEHHHH